MFLRDIMTEEPVVIGPKASVMHAGQLMQEHNLKRLPVMENGKLVGIITEADLMRALPSPATSLSKYEINYLSQEISVADTMSKKVFTATPDHTIEEAMVLMRQYDLSCLPIMDEDELVGIVTESNVFEAITKLFGLNRVGLRVNVGVEDQIGVLAELSAVIRDQGIAIIS